MCRRGTEDVGKGKAIQKSLFHTKENIEGFLNYNQIYILKDKFYGIWKEMIVGLRTGQLGVMVVYT